MLESITVAVVVLHFHPESGQLLHLRKERATLGVLTAHLLILLMLFVSSTPSLAADSKDDKKKQAEAQKERQEIRKQSKDILARLYKSQPSAKAAVQKAAGYATFSNFGLKIFVAGSGKGEGVAVDNKTKKETFMKMFEIQAGLGFGAKKFSLVWVFDTPAAFNGFVDSGWELGAQTSAAATTGDKGGALQGAIPVGQGVWVYQLTDKGVALELTAKGTKYYKDDDLN
jgi:lipid-binding SYLF domain-containing protein